ncbi:MAG: histone deacetylase family protein [Comamonas sp.]
MTVGKTGYFSHRDCWKHEMGPGHPECPQRLDAIDDRLLICGVADALEQREAPAAALADIARAHDGAYLQALHERCEQLAQARLIGGAPYAQIDPDTAINACTWQAALRAAGAGIAATDAVLAGELENAFCAVRPPGHHATRSQAMGFCFFNNVAIAALHALEHHGLERVAIVDFDVHHGNGTEDILAGDPRVLMVSVFQHPFFPFSGDQQPAQNMVNVPLPAYTKGMDIREIVEMIWLPRLEAFKPQMVFVSAGFDGHREDDMGQWAMNEQDYAWITGRIKDVARRFSKGRIVSCLEGGYAMSALGRSVEAHLRVLADL